MRRQRQLSTEACSKSIQILTNIALSALTQPSHKTHGINVSVVTIDGKNIKPALGLMKSTHIVVNDFVGMIMSSVRILTLSQRLASGHNIAQDMTPLNTTSEIDGLHLASKDSNLMTVIENKMMQYKNQDEFNDMVKRKFFELNKIYNLLKTIGDDATQFHVFLEGKNAHGASYLMYLTDPSARQLLLELFRVYFKLVEPKNIHESFKATALQSFAESHIGNPREYRFRLGSGQHTINTDELYVTELLSKDLILRSHMIDFHNKKIQKKLSEVCRLKIGLINAEKSAQRLLDINTEITTTESDCNSLKQELCHERTDPSTSADIEASLEIAEARLTCLISLRAQVEKQLTEKPDTIKASIIKKEKLITTTRSDLAKAKQTLADARQHDLAAIISFKVTPEAGKSAADGQMVDYLNQLAQTPLPAVAIGPRLFPGNQSKLATLAKLREESVREESAAKRASQEELDAGDGGQLDISVRAG